MIEIAMAAYNSEDFIAEQIESIGNQTYLEWHLTIQDDGSTDRTAEIVQQYQDRYPGKITYRKNETGSGGAKYNFYDLLLRLNADYIMTCDHDDVWLPNKIELTLLKMQELEQKYGVETPLLVHTDLKVTDGELNIQTDSMMFQQNLNPARQSLAELLVQNNITGCTMMINRALRELLPFKMPSHLIMHDWWLGLTAAAFGRIGYVEEATILYRQHGRNEVGAKNTRTIAYNAKRATQGAAAHEVLVATYRQAGDFLGIYRDRLSLEQRTFLQDYSNMMEYGKGKRIRILQRYGLWKEGVYRRLGQILYC